MRSILAVSLLLVSALTGCDFEPTGATGTAQVGEGQLGKKPSKSSRTPHTIQFSDDIGSAPVSVMLYANDPFQDLSSPTTPLVLPVSPELLGCGLTGGNWSPYEGEWTGYLVVDKESTGTTLTFWSSDADGTPFVLAAEGAATTQTVGNATVLTFTDVQVTAKKDESPLVIIQPCATFSITAVPQ